MSYAEEKVRLGEYLNFAQTAKTFPITLASIAETIYRIGNLLNPGDEAVPFALQVAAEANTAVFAFARIEHPPRYVRLGGGPPVTYAEPVDQSSVHGSRWVRGLGQAGVARRADLRASLLGVPPAVLRQSTTRGGEEAGHWDDLHRAVWEGPVSADGPALIAVRAWASSIPTRSARGKAARCLTLPYLELLQQLGRGDEVRFATALAAAVRGHQEYWPSTPERQADPDGFVSLPLTAAAAQAWDRGLRFRVESDYLPWGWVTGEAFRLPPAAP